MTRDYERILEVWKDCELDTYEDFMNALGSFRVLFACNSCALEGSPITEPVAAEVFYNVPLSSLGWRVLDLLDIQNQKFATSKLIKNLIKRKQLSVGMIKSLHKTLLYGLYDDDRWSKGERPGEFKTRDYCVGISGISSPPEDVELDLLTLVNDINSTDCDALTKAAYFHLKFETIHAFADGNGRVGRTIMNYILMLNGHPPITIFNEDKDTYYLALEVYVRTGKIDGFVQFLKEQTVKTWNCKEV